MRTRRSLPLLLSVSLIGCGPFDERPQAPKSSTEDGADGVGGAGADGGQNTAPGAATVLLSPDRPNTDDDVRVVIVAEAADAEGDAVSYRYRWFQDGAPREDLRTDAVPAAETRRGEVWRVQVVANDGELDGPPATASVTVVNALPTLSGVRLDPSPAFESSVLTAVVEGADDADGDPLGFDYTWLVNGAAVSGAASANLTGAHFDKGDVVQVTVRPDDGLDLGSSRSSAALTIQNSPPTAPAVSIRPADPVAGDALVCGLDAAAADVDGDSLSYSLAWVVDGVAYIDAVDGALVGDTVPAGETAAGQTWACAVTASDGSANAHLGEDEVVVGNVCGDGSTTLTASGMEFVTVCRGTFGMGCTPGQSSCFTAETPARTTTLTRDYHMSRFEVTQGQFAAVMGYNPSAFTTCGSSCPVETVSWHEAALFANAVSAAAGLARCYTCSGSGSSMTCSAPSSVYSCAGYRLPTEAEWEGAARCGEDLLYAGSGSIDAVAWYDGNSGSTTRPVAALAPNACGLYDMSGNVWEWTNDWFSGTEYGGGAATDPTGAASALVRAYRGGSWGDDLRYARVAARGSDIPDYQGFNVGLRLVRTSP